jgi:hypothetical protein
VVDDIVIVLTVSAKVFGAGALALEALRRMIVAAKGAAKELGVTNVTVEGDGALVAPENLTEAHAQFIARPAR